VTGASDAGIVVIGGGLVGLCFANLLARLAPPLAGRITVVDRAGPPAVGAEPGLRVSALSPGSARLLDRCEVWQDLPDDRVGPYRRMRVWRHQGPNGRDSIGFDAAEQGQSALGYIVENDLVCRVAWDRAEAAGVRLITRAAPATVSPGARSLALELDDGRCLSASLLVGADGAASWVREAAGLASRRWAYSQQGLVTHAACERPHEETAWQRFLPRGPLALLPLADGRVSVVWSCPDTRAAELLASGREGLGDALTAASEGVLGRLEPTVPARAFPLVAAHTHTYTSDRIVLIGDAAHQVHPLAGLGANLGLQDAAALAEALADFFGPGADLGDRRVLRRYERSRKAANMAALVTMDLMNRAFSGGNPALAALAGSGLGLVDRLPPLKRAFAAYAAGGTGRP
jgi:2-octaprenyl-3-methyl-6-methoxy-1,4-benzoquinol hydroxylase/2-octaprenylphenol hydroxylase